MIGADDGTDVIYNTNTLGSSLMYTFTKVCTTEGSLMHALQLAHLLEGLIRLSGLMMSKAESLLDFLHSIHPHSAGISVGFACVSRPMAWCLAGSTLWCCTLPSCTFLLMAAASSACSSTGRTHCRTLTSSPQPVRACHFCMPFCHRVLVVRFVLRLT